MPSSMIVGKPLCGMVTVRASLRLTATGTRPGIFL